MTRTQQIYEAGIKAAKKHPRSHIAIDMETLELVACGKNFDAVYKKALVKVPSGRVFFCGQEPAHACTTSKIF